MPVRNRILQLASVFGVSPGEAARQEAIDGLYGLELSGVDSTTLRWGMTGGEAMTNYGDLGPLQRFAGAGGFGGSSATLRGEAGSLPSTNGPTGSVVDVLRPGAGF